MQSVVVSSLSATSTCDKLKTPAVFNTDNISTYRQPWPYCLWQLQISRSRTSPVSSFSSISHLFENGRPSLSSHIETPAMDVPMLLAPPTPARSTSPASANRQPSRSPRPYRRRTLPSSTQRFSVASSSRNAAYLPSPLPTPDNSRTPSPLFFGGRRRRKLTWRQSAGGSESGTEADDELTKRLPAPPEKRKRTLSEEDKYYGEEEEEGAEDGDGRGRRRKRRTDVLDGGGKKRRKGIVFVRRGIEVMLMGILVAVVLYNGGEWTVWREVVSWRIGRPFGPFFSRPQMENIIWRGNRADYHQKSPPGYSSLRPLYSYIHFVYCFAKSLWNFPALSTLHHYSIQHCFQYWFLYL